MESVLFPIVSKINEYLSNYILIFLLVGVGLWYSIKTRFVQVRCPNYLGEILFWTGVLVGSLNILSGVGQWLTAILGYVCIVLIMFNGAQRLEKRQSARYGNDPAYRLYADKTPILIPFVPLYHLYKEEK